MTLDAPMVTVGGAGDRPGLCYIVNSLNPGGTERLVMEMALAFMAEYRVCVICLDEPGPWGVELRRRGVPVFCLWRQPGLDLSMPGKIARIVRDQSVSIVHAHQCTPWFYGALSRIFCSGPRLLLEEHGRFYPEADHALRRLVNRIAIIPLSHRFVAVSADVRRRLDRYEGLNAERTEIIYNGVDVGERLSNEERQVLRGELGVGSDEFLVGTVGRFDPIKNLPMLVSGLVQAYRSERRVRGLLVGDGPVFGSIEDLIQDEGLTDTVRLTGFRDDARRLVQCMDLFVLSSLSEGTSMALLEAMAGGVPVVVTAVGGNPEIVLAKETGWVVPSGDARALSIAILEAARDPVLRERFARAGRQRFSENYTFGRMIECYRSLYRTMMAASAREIS